MRAVLSRTAGDAGTLVIEPIADPECGPGDVVIDVHACGLNYPDVLIIEDRYQFKPPRPFAPGGEVAGVIRSIGSAVRDLHVGNRVIGSVGWGGMAERIAAPAGVCTVIPDSMPFDEAAAFLMTFGTSYHALKQRAGMKSGERLLVLGAAGGVGIAAVQLGKALGGTVIAAASSDDKITFARQHGADEGVIYPTGNFDAAGRKTLAATFKTAAGANGIDIVYDAVGGDHTEAALRALAWNGRLLIVGFPAGIPAPPLNLVLLKGAALIGVFYGTFLAQEPEAGRKNIAELFALYEAGKIRPIISRHFAFEQAADAIRHLSNREAMGKVVVTMPAAVA